jgi:hypothetical protein
MSRAGGTVQKAGVAEVGFFPGIILCLTYWYTAAERVKVVGMFNHDPALEAGARGQTRFCPMASDEVCRQRPACGRLSVMRLIERHALGF